MTGSSEGRIARGRLERFRGDQMVVSLDYAQQMARRLEALGAPLLDGPETDERLGLALLTFDASAALTGLVKNESGTVKNVWSRERRRLDDPSDPRGPSDLHVLIGALRKVLSREHGGWCPTFGKNRLVDRVEDLHAIQDEGRVRPTSVEAGILPDHAIIDEGSGGAPRREDTPSPAPRRSAHPGQGVRVGVVDRALLAHPYLLGAFVADAADVVGADQPSDLAARHATFVAGLVLREAPGAVVVLRRVGIDGSSRDSWVLAQRIVELSDQGVDVINLSLGCFTDDNQPPLVLERAMAAVRPSTLVVAAAGNYRTADAYAPTPCWPAALDNVLAVGALQGEARADFSPEAPWVDAMAPGVGVSSTLVDPHGAGYGRWDGTSFAAALVSGAIAARVVPGRRDARAAWSALVDEAKRDDHGRPLVASHPVAGWPVDADAGPAGISTASR